MEMRIAAVDRVSNTCFPALAAEELGFYKAEGLDAHAELFPMLGATKALRNGSADAMIAGSVHDVLTEFPGWKGAKLIVALSQGTPWLLVVRADDVSFGVFAARALEAGEIDGFWANAMRSETAAVRRGVGKILVDVRRGDDPAAVRNFTFAALVTTDALIEREQRWTRHLSVARARISP